MSKIIAGLVVLGGIVLSGLGYFFTSPRVILTTPISGSKDVDAKSNIVIKFDRPVSRRALTESIYPDTPGKWSFKDNLYKSFFYRTLVFTPDLALKPGTDYSIKLINIKNSLQTTKPYDFEVSFQTKPDAVITQAITKQESETFKLSVPAYIQQHTLSCEVASLRMTLAYKGITKSEDELLAQVGVDNTPHIDGTWGNPYEHFVGNVNGSQLRDGYGVYWDPIERVAKMFGNAQAFQNGTVQMLTKNIQAGNPIIIWVYSESGAPTHWKTPTGVNVFAVAGEHTVVVVGYVGPPDNPTQIIVNDSLVGQSYWPRSFFDHKWATFSEAGVIIYK